MGIIVDDSWNPYPPLITHSKLVFLGCGLAVEILYDVVQVWDIPIIGCPASDLGLSASSADYSIVSRTSITYTSITYTLMRFFRANNYTTPVVFQDQSVLFFDLCGLLMQTTLRVSNEELFYGTSFIYFQSAKDKLDTIEEQMVKASLSSRGKMSTFVVKKVLRPLCVPVRFSKTEFRLN
jgi:hypothetical protein